MVGVVAFCEGEALVQEVGARRREERGESWSGEAPDKLRDVEKGQKGSE